MALNRWLGAILLTSVIALTGCGSKPPASNPSTPSTSSTTTTTTTTTMTPAATATGTPVAATMTPAATGTPMASTTPSASGSPKTGAAPAAGDDYANAEGQPGYEEVLAMAVPKAAPDAAAKGKAVFEANCTSCHGANADGTGDAGKALDPPPRNLHAKDEYKYGTGDKSIFRTVKYGVDGTGMAPLEGVITEEQMWDVVRYVHTLQG